LTWTSWKPACAPWHAVRPQPAEGAHAVARVLRPARDAASGAVYLHGQPMDLTAREAALLRALLARPGHAVAKERLSELVFAGEADVQADAIEVVVYRLRKKLAATGVQLVTLRGLGYLLKDAA
jgi:two-component system response regulator TctD